MTKSPEYLIWRSIRKNQIKLEIFSNLCGLLRNHSSTRVDLGLSSSLLVPKINLPLCKNKQIWCIISPQKPSQWKMQSLFSLYWQIHKKKIVWTKNGITHLELIGFPVPVLVKLPANRPIFSSAQLGSTSIYQAHFRRQDIFLIESVVHQRLPPLWPLIQAYRQGHLRLTGFCAK